MTEAARNQLVSAGIQVGEALERLMGSEALFERLLKKFLSDDTFHSLEQAMAAGDRETAFQAAHTLKGLCGNLSLERLGNLAVQQTELLRKPEGWEEAKLQMPALSDAYKQVQDAIRQVVG